jgi:hypothetical protein
MSNQNGNLERFSGRVFGGVDGIALDPRWDLSSSVSFGLVLEA